MEKNQIKKNSKVFLSVVIPAYNEEKNILSTLKATEAFLEKQSYTYEVLVMDDGSSDSTLNIANNFAKNSKNIQVHNLVHRGKAPTVIDGIKNSNGKYILFCDADLATPIEEVKKLLHYLVEDKYDIAIASREGVGAVRKNEPLMRHIMGRVFNLLIQLILFKGIEDTQCGFKLFKSEAAKKIISKMKLYENAKQIKVARVSAFDVEILFIAKKLGFSVKSIPVEWNYVETTRVNPIRDSFVNFLDVVRVYINDKKGLYK